MRRSMIITTTLISIVLCIVMIGFGVYANMNQTYSVSNKIGFNPSTDVYVSLECQVAGCKQTEIATPPEGYSSMMDYYEAKGFVKFIDFDESTRGQKQVLPDWNISESLEFINYQTSIFYKIKVYNYSDREITISFENIVTDNPNFENIVPEPIILAGYQRGENVACATITLETKVVNYGGGFAGERNDFQVAFTATED